MVYVQHQFSTLLTSLLVFFIYLCSNYILTILTDGREGGPDVKKFMGLLYYIHLTLRTLTSPSWACPSSSYRPRWRRSWSQGADPPPFLEAKLENKVYFILGMGTLISYLKDSNKSPYRWWPLSLAAFSSLQRTEAMYSTCNVFYMFFHRLDFLFKKKPTTHLY